jgi:hypothetical protein
MYFWTQDRRDGSCVCNNWQIEYYMKHKFQANNPQTYLWNFFDIIIIDEIHSLSTDATYADAPFYLFDFIKAAYRLSKIKTVLLTATFAPIKGLVKLKNIEDYAFWDVTDECKITPTKGSVNTNVPGTYKLEYEVTYKGTTKTVSRIVVVKEIN